MFLFLPEAHVPIASLLIRIFHLSGVILTELTRLLRNLAHAEVVPVFTLLPRETRRQSRYVFDPSVRPSVFAFVHVTS